MSYSSPVRGKSNQSLEGHSLDVLYAMDSLLDTAYAVLCDLETRFKWHSNYVRDLARFVALFHDTGKSTTEWQEYLRRREEKRSTARLSHAITSFAIARLLLDGLVQDEGDKGWSARLACLAILAHHSQLHDSAFQSTTQLGADLLFHPLDKLCARWQKENTKVPIKSSNPEKYTRVHKGKFPLERFRSEVMEWKYDIRSGPRKLEEVARTKALYSFFLGSLTIADGIASRAIDDVKGYHDGCYLAGHPVLSELKNYAPWTPTDPTFLNRNKPNKMQKDVLKFTDSSLILEAPCGTGKTAAALRYALQIARRRGLRGIIYTLPTQVTSNNMCIELEKKYGLGSGVGIYHSEVLSFLLDKERKEGETTDSALEALKDECYRGMTYQNSATVTTLDHLVLTLCHGFRHADRSLLGVMSSIVIFDELHYYDVQTLKVARTAMELLAFLGVPFMVMTATLPSDVSNQLDWQTYEYIPTRKDGKPWKPWFVEKRSEPVTRGGDINTTFLDDVAKTVKRTRSSKSIVVVNRVESCKKVYSELNSLLPDRNVLMYHSEFTSEDRMRKERLIRILFSQSPRRKPEDRAFLRECGFADSDEVVLVSTQVSEISLDISSDLLLTELAPADSIIQRGGRLHRRGVAPISGDCEKLSEDARCKNDCKSGRPSDFLYRLVVYPIDFSDAWARLPYEDPDDPTGVLERTWKAIRGGEFSVESTREILDSVYRRGSLGRLAYDSLLTYFHEDLVFGKRPAERHRGSEGGTTCGWIRSIPYAIYPVIPLELKHRITDKASENRRLTIHLRDKKFYKAVRDGRITEHEGYNIIDLPYGFEKGLDSGQL